MPMPREIAEKHLRELGFEVEDEHGILMVIVPEEEYAGSMNKIRDIVKKSGYPNSYGVRLKRKGSSSDGAGHAE